jgi:hypothetical protein
MRNSTLTTSSPSSCAATCDDGSNGDDQQTPFLSNTVLDARERGPTTPRTRANSTARRSCAPIIPPLQYSVRQLSHDHGVSVANVIRITVESNGHDSGGQSSSSMHISLDAHKCNRCDSKQCNKRHSMQQETQRHTQQDTLKETLDQRSCNPRSWHDVRGRGQYS